MRILHVITTIDVGGAEVQLLSLAQKQAEEGNLVSIMPVKGKLELAERFADIGVEVSLSVVDKNPLLQLFLLRRYLKNNIFDIVHAHLPRAQLLAAYAKRVDNALIITRHDAMPFFVNAPIWLSLFLWRRVQKRTQKIITISSAIRKKMVERFELRTEAEALVVYYGISESRAPSVHENLDLPPAFLNKSNRTMFVFGTIARLIDEKNIQALIRGFALVRIKCPESSLIIVGYGPLLESLRNLAEDLGISKYVYFTGKQMNAIDFLSKMDTFVLPSRTEGFGLVLLEAMSTNLPIIASRVDGIPEVLGDNCGLLFDPKDIDELARLMLSTTDPAINLSLRSASAKRIKQFSIAESERKIRVIYTNALKEFKLDH